MIILAKAFLEALGAAGVIRVEDRVRRVVIDAKIGDAVVVHVERYGDEKLLEVTSALTGVEVTATSACTCDLVDASEFSGKPYFVRGESAGCRVHGTARDAAIAAAREEARQR